MVEPLRVTRQLSADHWQTACKVCPKRMGRKNTSTQQAADEWWAQHVETKWHKAYAKRGPDELNPLIVGPPSKPPVPAADRVGELVIRPNRLRYKGNDNPRGA